MSAGHQPVLLAETLRLLAPRPGAVVVDGTVGRGGHAEALARAIASGEAGAGPSGTLLIVDRDPENLAFAAARLDGIAQELPNPPTILAEHASFVELPRLLRTHGLRADLLLADLGFSSSQMDDAERGFSFQREGPLDMRLDPTGPTTAADLVNSLGLDDLTDVIRRLGEDPMARSIARNVVRARDVRPIETTAELAGLVVEAYGRRARSSRMHPATRTFMALRIALNDELGALERLLEQLVRGARTARAVAGRMETSGAGGAEDAGDGIDPWLQWDARVAIIAFHSLEDRIVKHAFAALEREGLAERLTRKPITASGPETGANPRARSAKLRAVRLGSPADPGREAASAPS